MRILIVEDEDRISSFVRKGLEEQGFVAEVCADGDDGLHMALSTEFDALVLDIMVPGRDGLSILKELRQKGHTVPVILLTARTGLDDRVQGLDLGADDYLTKPFYVEELIARLRAVQRRQTGEKTSVRHLGGVTMNLMNRTIHAGEEELTFTPREFNLLEYLSRTPGRVYTRTQILEHVWGYYFDPKTNIVDVYIQRIRAKLPGERKTSMIETVRGVGYRLRPREASPGE